MEELKFEELELCPEILKAVKHMGFEEASPIQSKAIPVIMSGKDVIGQAQTGTGKTAAFGIPMLQKIDEEDRSLQGMTERQPPYWFCGSKPFRRVHGLQLRC